MAHGTPVAMETGADTSAGQISVTTDDPGFTADREYFLAFMFQTYDAGEGDPTVSGHGLTWNYLSKVYASGASLHTYLYRGTGTPTSGGVTISRAGSASWDDIVWCLLEVPTDDYERIAGTNYTTSASTDLTVALSGVTSNNMLIAAFGVAQNYACTERSGWTELTELGAATCHLQIQYLKSDDTNAYASWGSGTNASAICWELSDPGTEDVNETLPVTSCVFSAQALTVEDQGTPISNADGFCENLTFVMDVGEILNIGKTLPIDTLSLDPKPLEVDYTGFINNQTLSGVTNDISPGNLIVAMRLPAIQVQFTPQSFDQLGFVLFAIKQRNLVTRDFLDPSIAGFRPEEELLVKKKGGLVKTKHWKEIVDEIDVLEYDEQG